MNEKRPGQMMWKSEGTSSTRILHLRHHPLDKWQPYTNFPEYALPDPPGFSEGYATFLSLLRKNWQALSNS
jgi:hypothetical protein